MSRDTPDDDPDLTEIILDGEGPFMLPLCDSKVDLGIGDVIALLTVTTLEGQKIEIPFGLPVLQQLHALTGQALAQLAKPAGDKLQ